MKQCSSSSSSSSSSSAPSDLSGYESKAVEFQLCDIKLQKNSGDHKLYSIRFCDFVPALRHYFATAGSNAVSIYRVDTAGLQLELVQHFVDSDAAHGAHEEEDSEAENFYTCAWALTAGDHAVVVAAGKRGTLKAIHTVTGEVCALFGHGDLVNELRAHTLDPGLIFSASRDRSVRLWNLRSMVCIAVFGGERGHRDEVLSLDVHLLGNCFASTGMDTSIKVWNLQDPQLLRAIERSDDLSIVDDPERAFPVIYMHFPLFSTTQLHTDYVDCVRWVGDCMLTKSTNNRIALWAPDAQRHKSAPLILHEYVLSHCSLWFMKFEVCIPLGLLALGNTKGKIQAFSVGPHISSSARTTNDSSELVKEKDPKLFKERFQFEHRSDFNQCALLSNSKSSAVIRQVSFSMDARFMVSCFDDGSINLWSINERSTTIVSSS